MFVPLVFMVRQQDYERLNALEIVDLDIIVNQEVSLVCQNLALLEDMATLQGLQIVVAQAVVKLDIFVQKLV